MIKQFGLACLMGASLLAAPAMAQQSSGSMSSSSGMGNSSSNFVTRQSDSEWRASKVVGVDVYSSDNQKLGTVNDILLKSDGTAGALVIGSGGVLGAGEKYVAVPFDGVKWSTQGRTIAAGGSSTAGSASSGGQAATAAAQGYPDRAILPMTKSAFDGAPSFNYAQAKSNPGNNGSTRSN
ncbi:MAG TPA: PRC-barrel domain-containing protein [Beijerinckiaceae bacterium]|jgi:sporulation protein YlmC with PRC-barrel domain|nr:PRC-barrel domain-containing protein [Beijerinckiaceae bacterium]